MSIHSSVFNVGDRVHFYGHADGPPCKSCGQSKTRKVRWSGVVWKVEIAVGGFDKPTAVDVTYQIDRGPRAGQRFGAADEQELKKLNPYKARKGRTSK